MGNIEITVRLYDLAEIIIVETIGNQLDRGIRHDLELLLDERRHSHHYSRIIQNLLLQTVMLPLRPFAETQMLEIEHLGPRVTEIRHPRNAGRLGKLPGYEVHRLRRAGTYNRVHRILLEVLLQEPDRRPYPCHPRVRNKQIAAQEQYQFLLESLLLATDRIDLLLRGILLSGQFPVERIKLRNMPLHDNGLLRNILFESLVNAGHFRIFRGIDDRLPSELRQILAEFHPSLDTGTSCRRPVICYDKHLLHSHVKIVIIFGRGC